MLRVVRLWSNEAGGSGVSGYVLAGIRRMWQCRVGGGVPESRHRICGCGVRVWLDGPNDGLCNRPHFGMPLNSAVSVGLAVGRRFSWGDLLPYIVAQMLGAVAGAVC